MADHWSMKHLGTQAYANVSPSSPRYSLAILHEKLPAVSNKARSILREQSIWFRRLNITMSDLLR
jgi:hypothetical protein